MFWNMEIDGRMNHGTGVNGTKFTCDQAAQFNSFLHVRHTVNCALTRDGSVSAIAAARDFCSSEARGDFGKHIADLQDLTKACHGGIGPRLMCRHLL